MDLLRTERRLGVWYSYGVEGRGVPWVETVTEGLAEVYGRLEKRRGRCGLTSPGEERGNETGRRVVIVHGSVEPAKWQHLA